MKRILFATVLILLSFQTVYSAEKYAVLITGDYDPRYLPDDVKGYGPLESFWNDTYLMWEMLIEKGFNDSNIFVLFGNGEGLNEVISDTTQVPSRYTPESIGYDREYSIVDGWGTFQGIESAVDSIASRITQDDFLFVWTFDHGGFDGCDTIDVPLNDSIPHFLYLVDPDCPDTISYDIIHDYDFADLFNPLSANKKVYWMQQCYSGGFEAELTDGQSNVFFNSSTKWDQWANDMTDDFTVYYEDFNDTIKVYSYSSISGIENESLFDKTNIHGEFNFHMISSTTGKKPSGSQYYYETIPSYLPQNLLHPVSFSIVDGFRSNIFNTLSDNVITVEESYRWTEAFHSFVPPGTSTPINWSPYCSDNDSIGYHTSLEYPTLIFNNYSEYSDCLKGIMGISDSLNVTSNLTLPDNSYTTLLEDRVITITAGDTLRISNNSTFKMMENSEIDIQNGGILYLEPLSTIDTDSSSVITEETGGHIVAGAPENVEITETSGTISLSWDSVNEAVEYHVFRSVCPDSCYSEIGDPDSTFFTESVDSLSAGAYFYYIVADYSVAGLEIQSLPSDIIGFGKYSNITTSGTDINHISLPLDAGYTVSSDFDPTGSNINSIQKWDALNQSWVASDFISNEWEDTFNVYEGQAYLINATNNHDMYITGNYVDIPSYELITNPNDSDYNFIMHPLGKYNLTTSEMLGDDIGAGTVCNVVCKWNAASQVWVNSSYTFGSWKNIFDSYISLPLLLNIKEDVTWPSESKYGKWVCDESEEGDPKINMPRSVYYHVVNSKHNDFDFSDTNPKLSGTQPKDNFISFKAWVSGREEDILTDCSYGCGFEQIGDGLSSIFINLGNFKNKWQPGEVINFEVIDRSDMNNPMIGKGSCVIDKESAAIVKGLGQVNDELIIIGTPTGEEEMIPYETALYQNYPNPFNPVTMINFSLKDDCKANVRVYNYKGQLAQELVNGNLKRGNHSVEFNAGKLGSGVYFYTLEAGGKTFTRKMVLTK